ncbi:MAG: DUF4153 domain-containing protein [Thermodesulfobacteriota bacterium]|nr:MAG: DUF4153 domain-containing protein [Thermodesulfobacteriota bacterium]
MYISEKYARLLINILTGFFQGLIFWISTSYWGVDESSLFGKNNNIFLASISAFAIISGLVLQFGWTNRCRIPLFLISLSTGLVYAAITAWTISMLPAWGVPFKGDNNRITTLFFGSACSLYIFIPYLQVFVENGSLKFPYTDLFKHSWNNFFVAAIALLFTGIFWGLIGLWGGLFHLIGIAFFANIFFTKEFMLVATPVAFGLGIMIGKDLNAVTITLRNVALLVFKTLMPLLSIIALLFIFALPFTGLKPLWDTRMSSVITLLLLACTVIFINAVFQNGNSKPPYPAWIRRGVEGMLLALPAYAAITLYSIWLRIDQYGFMPDRVYALIFALIAAFYSVGYAVAVLVKKNIWLGLMRSVNIAVSLIVMAIAILIHTPVLDPISISAESQFKMLAAGRIDPAAFEYQVLKFQLGQNGFEKLKALSEMKDHPEAEAIRERAKKTIEQDHFDYAFLAKAARTEAEPKAEALEFKEEHLNVLTSSKELPVGLMSAITSSLQGCGDILALCVKQKDCAVFSRNMDDDMEEEYIFVQSEISCGGLHLFDRVDGQNWSYIGEMRQTGDDIKSRSSLIKAIEEATLMPAVPKYLDLENTGNEKWHFELSNGKRVY